MAANTATTITDRLLNGSDFNMFYKFQTTKGTVDSNPDWTPYRRGEGVALLSKSYTEGADIPQDRQAVKQLEESDEYTAELSGGFHKQAVAMLVAALAGGTETQVSVTGTDIAADADGFTDVDNLAFADLEVGDGFWATGFSDSSLNRFYVISTKNGDGDVETSPAPATTESAGQSVTITSNLTRSGETETLLMMQRRAPDTSKTGDTDYLTVYDGYINTFSLEIPETGTITSSMNLLFGKRVSGTGEVSGQTDNSVPTDSELTATANVEEFYVADTKQDCTVKSLSLEVNNNYQADDGAGCDKEYALGQLTVTGSVVVRAPINSPFTWRDYYDNATDVGTLGVMFSHDSSGTDQTYIVVDNIKVTEHSMPTTANTTANSEASFTAQRNDSLGTTIRVFRNWV